MYSSFATQGLAKPGQLVTRDIFAPLARENAGGLAEIGYFTTLKIDGKSAAFGPVKDGDTGWKSVRPPRHVFMSTCISRRHAARPLFHPAGRRS